MPQLRQSKSLDRLSIFRSLSKTKNKAYEDPPFKVSFLSSECAVCDCSLRFTGSTCFRCTICDTINDLKSAPSDDSLKPIDLKEYVALDDKEKLLKRISQVFSSARCLNESFPSGKQTTMTDSGIALADVREFYTTITKNPELTSFMHQTINSLLNRPGKKIRKAHDARFLLILMENPQLGFRKHKDTRMVGQYLLPKVLGLISSLPTDVHQFLVNWFGRLPMQILQTRIELVNSFLSCRLAKLGRRESRKYDTCWQVKAAARTMALFYSADRGRLPIKLFYNPLTDYIDFEADFLAWKNRRERFSFCQYPFFITLKQKQQILASDAARQQRLKVREAYFASLDSGRSESAVLELKIRREHLLEDSLREIPAHEDDLKKKLVVRFLGEEGVDAGGLRKEFFLLLCRQFFDDSFGMFTKDDESGYYWFSHRSERDTTRFYLLGVIMGLAIYNSTILDMPLPPALFKKLLGQSCGLSDLKILHPQLGNGLQQLLEYEGDVESSFCRDFVIGNGTELIPDGAAIPVTNANRKEFVHRYVQHILDESCSRQVFHLARGFHQVAGGNAVSLLKAEEIELLVRGSPEPLNILDLQNVCAYDGFPAATTDPLSEPVIANFWKVVGRMSATQQRRLLSFITGSDRIPATGTVDLKFRISIDRHASKNRLPVAHTCFSQIILACYLDAEELEERLLYSLSEGGCEGFAMA